MDLWDKVGIYGLGSAEVMQVLRALNADALPPYDIRCLACILFWPVEYDIFESKWTQLAGRVIVQNAALGQQDPRCVIGTDELLGMGNFADLHRQVSLDPLVLDQCQRTGMAALIQTIEMAALKESFVTVVQGAQEPFLQFAERLTASIERQVEDLNVRMLLLKHLARTNCNAECRRIIEVLPGDPSASQMAEACAKVGTTGYKVAAMATVLRPASTGPQGGQRKQGNAQTSKKQERKAENWFWGNGGFGSTGSPQVHWTAVLTKDHPEKLCILSIPGATPEIRLHRLLDTVTDRNLPSQCQLSTMLSPHSSINGGFFPRVVATRQPYANVTSHNELEEVQQAVSARQVYRIDPSVDVTVFTTTPRVNPRGLRASEIWQTDVTQVAEFGRLKCVHVTVDTFFSVMWASAHTEEKTRNVIAHWRQVFAVLGIPPAVKTDNGPAYTSQKALDKTHQPRAKVWVQNLVIKQWEGPYDLIASGHGYMCVSTDTRLAKREQPGTSNDEECWRVSIPAVGKGGVRVGVNEAGASSSDPRSKSGPLAPRQRLAPSSWGPHPQDTRRTPRHGLRLQEPEEKSLDAPLPLVERLRKITLPRDEEDSLKRPAGPLQAANLETPGFIASQEGPILVTSSRHEPYRLRLTEGLYLRTADWTFLSINTKEQGAWPVQGKELVIIGDCKYTPQEVEILPGVLVNNPRDLVLWLRCTHPPTFIPKGQVIAQIIPTRGPNNTPVACPVQAITEERPRVDCEFRVGGETINITGLLDTGADVTVVPAQDWPSHWALQDVAGHVQGVGGLQLARQSRSIVQIKGPKGQLANIRPFVLDYKEPLLGRDLMSQWGVKIDIPDPSVEISAASIDERPTKKLNWLTNKPVWVEQWPLSKPKLKALEELVKEQLAKGHIVETDSPWNSPVFVIQKPGKDKWRLLQDLRQINNVIEDMGSLQPGMPSPTMLPQNWQLAVIDIKDCFFQIPLHPDDAPRFAFSVPTINREAPRRRYHWRVLPQGMKNSPVICQWYVASLLSPVRAAAGQAIIYHYMDDVLVCAPNDDMLSHVLGLTVDALVAAGFELQEEKVQRMPPWKYLGLEIGRRTIVPQKLAIRTKGRRPGMP
ncbi:uncharacterized protein LOC131378769 [Hirundo rustica]|uniref:uncharacterized protein LOC131378769 n=1 Tax=Hirundo rustica TaxID=43150 RepID=UPI0026737FDE|nr:uncharacterized protein LOC131378769 [Hirundo rustica]